MVFGMRSFVGELTEINSVSGISNNISSYTLDIKVETRWC